MSNRTILDIEFLKEKYSYNPETGDIILLKLTHKYRHKNKLNKPIGSITSSGYITVRGITRTPIMAQRVAWVLYYNEQPPDYIDHIDRNPSNNKISNLRATTNQLNMVNKELQCNNSSGFVGVSYCKERKLWESYIKFNGKKINLGRFQYIKDAANTYNKKAIELFGEFARLNEII